MFQLIIAKMDRELLEDKVRAKARLAVRLRERDKKHSSSFSLENGTKGGESEEDNETRGFGFCDMDGDNDDDCNFDSQPFSSSELPPLPPPLSLISFLKDATQPPSPPSIDLKALHTHEKYMIQNEIRRNTHNYNNNISKNENLIPNSTFIVENNENKTKNIGLDTDPFICVPQLLYEFLPIDQSNQSLENLFVTHAQYKFIYKFACECNKEK